SHSRIGLEEPPTTHKVIIGRRGAMRCADAERISLAQPEIAKFGAADAHRIFQHSLEYGFQFARRAADDFQDFRRSPLLLQLFAEIVDTLTKVTEHVCVLDRDDALRSEVLN